MDRSRSGRRGVPSNSLAETSRFSLYLTGSDQTMQSTQAPSSVIGVAPAGKVANRRSNARAEPIPSLDVFEELFYTIEALRVENVAFILQCTAAEAGAGTTTVAMGYAMAAAIHGGGPVLYVDASASSRAKPSLPTLATVIGERRPLANIGTPMESVPNLSLIGLGATGSSSLGLTLAELDNGFKALRKVFPITVLDTAPVLKSPAASALARLCDGTLLTVASRRTRPRDVKRAIAMLRRSGGQIIGTIYNGDKA